MCHKAPYYRLLNAVIVSLMSSLREEGPFPCSACHSNLGKESLQMIPSYDCFLLHQVDHSIVENFVQGGRMAITSRVYPTEAVKEQAHVFLFNNGSTDVTVRKIDIWQMKNIHEFMQADSSLEYRSASW